MDTFQLKIFKEINKGNIKKNFTISPLSIYHILSLAANGAVNKTLEEMCHSLGHNDIDEMNKNNELLASFFENFKSVELANAVFTKYKLEESFAQKVKQYKAKVDKLKSVDQVNKWCSESTHHKIQKILDRIYPEDIIILINAIYFKGVWKNRFNKNESRINEFYNYNDQPVEINFMIKTDKYDYYKSDEVQAILLNYNDDDMEAMIILPNKYKLYDKPIDAFIDEFTVEDYNKILKKMKNTKVELHLPKFEFEYEDDLSKYLSALGMEQAFAANGDFSSMIREGKANVGKVIHKTYLKIDEEGTEAAAVTAIRVKKSISFFNFKPEIPRMYVGHPFIFIIRNKKLPRGYDIIFISKIEKIDTN